MVHLNSKLEDLLAFRRRRERARRTVVRDGESARHALGAHDEGDEPPPDLLAQHLNTATPQLKRLELSDEQIVQQTTIDDVGYMVLEEVVIYDTAVGDRPPSGEN